MDTKVRQVKVYFVFPRGHQSNVGQLVIPAVKSNSGESGQLLTINSLRRDTSQGMLTVNSQQLTVGVRA